MATPKIMSKRHAKKGGGGSGSRLTQIRTVDGQLLRRGCIVCCRLALAWEHSGVYVGKGEIIHLINEKTRDGRDGRLVKTRPRAFLELMEGRNPAWSVYVACNGNGEPLRCESCAKKAEYELKLREQSIYYGNYSALFRNCHHFSGDCLIGYRRLEEETVWGKLCSAMKPLSLGFSWLESSLEKEHGSFRWVECELEN